MTWNTKHLSTALNDLERIADETLMPHDEYVSILVFFLSCAGRAICGHTGSGPQPCMTC